jgi:hypothetical protein
MMATGTRKNTRTTGAGNLATKAAIRALSAPQGIIATIRRPSAMQPCQNQDSNRNIAASSSISGRGGALLSIRAPLAQGCAASMADWRQPAIILPLTPALPHCRH